MIDNDRIYFDEFSKLNEEEKAWLDKMMCEEAQGVEVQQFERFEGNRKERRMQASLSRRKGKK